MSEQEILSSPPAETPRRVGRPLQKDLLDYKDLIIQLYVEEELPVIEISRRLNLEFGLDIGERSVSRRLKAWNVPLRGRGGPSEALCERVTYYYNRNLNDKEMILALEQDGHEIKRDYLTRLRQKLGLRRKGNGPGYSMHSEGEDEEEEDEEDGSHGEYGMAPEGAHGPGAVSSPSPRKKLKGSQGNASAREKPGLIGQVTPFVEKYMAQYDGSHDFNHIRRVVGLAHQIYRELTAEKAQADARLHFESAPALDLQVITLAALLHDVGDKKYLAPGEDGSALVASTLLGFGAKEELATRVQRIVLGVSYSSEVADPARVTALIAQHPELAVVQDADRLDAIGAVGIGRTFTFGGARGAREMGETIQHFADKLDRLEGLMKTGPGRRMARERTERLTVFRGWWEDEQAEAEGVLRRSR